MKSIRQILKAKIIVAAISLMSGCGTEASGEYRQEQLPTQKGPASTDFNIESSSGFNLSTALPTLNVGESKTIKVIAAQYANFAIQVHAGEIYDFSTPSNATWTDFFIRTGPGGFASHEAPLAARRLLSATEKYRRVPTANWFALSACVGDDPAQCFAIGASSTKAVTQTGLLMLFANDLPIAYGNNSGDVLVTIRRRR